MDFNKWLESVQSAWRRVTKAVGSRLSAHRIVSCVRQKEFDGIDEGAVNVILFDSKLIRESKRKNILIKMMMLIADRSRASKNYE
jgi:hypothetical protein